MKTLDTSALLRLFFIFLLVLTQLATSACTFNLTRYTDGPLTQYLSEPIPKLNRPIARTLSLEKITFQTAVNMKATIISDLLAREIYILPSEVGRDVKRILELDNEYSEKTTYAALNTIAKNKAEARHLNSNAKAQTVLPSTIASNTGNQQYIQRQERMAKEAYSKGDYLGGDIHNSAAINSMQINQSFAQAQASVDMAFSLFSAAAAAGQALIKSEFNNLRNWIEFKSGAIGTKAPKGNHLSIFFLQFFDAESFQFDSRNRVTVYMVLTDKNGIANKALEGSDILNCEGECNLFQPKPTSRIFEKAAQSADVQQKFWTAEGNQTLIDNGFDPLSGFYQYILLQHGLHKLSKAVK